MAKLSTMVDAAAADRQPAIATTDHGSLGATWRMAGLCTKAGLKYIPGAELYLAFGDRRTREGLAASIGAAEGAGSDAETASTGTKKYQHLTVLAASQTGWRNLLLVSNAAHDPEAYWSKPRADMDLLAEHADGLIVLTGCAGGPVAGRLLRGEPEVADANLARLVEAFGPQRVFVEVMDHGIEAERRILPDLVNLARRYGLRVVATNDCHYTMPGQHTAHDALLCLADGEKTLSSPDRWRFDGSGYHLRSAAEMRVLFDDQPGTEEACDATLLVAEMVEKEVIPEARMHLPRFPLPEGVTAERRLFELVKTGARDRYGDPYPEVVRDRLRHEYRVVTEKGLCCHPGTAITYANGSVRPISEVKPGDEVWTDQGAGRVEAVAKRRFVGAMIYIKSFGFGPLRVTPEHPVLTENRGWVKATDVRVGDWLVSNPRVDTKPSGLLYVKSLFSEEEWDRLNIDTDGEMLWRMRPGRWGTERKALGALPVLLDPSDHLLYLIGIYAAEGCLNGKPVNGQQGEVVWTIHLDETYIVERVQAAVEAFGGTLRVYESYYGSQALRLVTTHHLLAAVLGKLVGKLAHSKAFHPWVMNLDPERQARVIEAWHHGDGTIDSRGRSVINTIGQKLAWQGHDMLMRAGVSCSLTKVSYSAPRHDCYFLTWWPGRRKAAYGRRLLQGGRIASKVREVCRRTYDGPVFNLEVAESHTYIADGRITHNCDYFLILADVIAWARSHGIRVGPGRGSAGGSVISYCLGIVTIDPIRYGLLFERFLSPDRVGMPDIDTDFEQGRREEVFGYLTAKYGVDYTAHIGTYTLQLTNAALRNAGRVLDDPGLGARLAAKVPSGPGGKPLPFAVLDDEQSPAGAELRAVAATESGAPRVLKIARAFEGNVTAEGIHACGFIISDEPLPGLVPLRRDRRKGRDGRGLVTEWDGIDCDAAGMLKLDVLGIRNLDVIAATEHVVFERTGEQVDAASASDDVDDPDPVARGRARAAWQLVAEGRTAGVFQLESAGMTDLAQRVAPTSIEELSAIVALFRPGPLGAKTHDRYAERKAGREPVDYGIFTDDPTEEAVIADLLGDTYGLMIYQEQMMRVGQVVAGFDAYGRDRLRKAIGKKLAAEMASVGEAFLTGAVSDVDAEGRPKLAFKRTTAEALWHGMESAAAYAFNKSHSVGYAKLAYETAWLKASWPAAFGAGLLSVTGAEDRRIPILRSLGAEGITVSTPDVNLGEVHTTLGPDGVVRLGLSEIKGMRADDARAIVAERRRGGSFSSLADLLGRVRVDRAGGTPLVGDPGDDDPAEAGAGSAISLASARALIEAGACDGFGPRAGLVRAMRALRDAEVPVPATEWGVVERAGRERERLGAVVSGNPLKLLSDQLRSWRSPSSGVKPVPLHRVEERCTNGASVSTVGAVASLEVRRKGRRRAHVVLEGSLGSLEGVIWSDQLQALERADRLPAVGDVVGVDARVRKTTVVVSPETSADETGAGADDDLDAPPADGGRSLETMTKTELTIYDVWTGELEDEGRRALPSLRVPRRR